MGTAGYTLFETAIGWCGIAWGERGVTAVELPGATAAQTRARLRRSAPPDAEERSIVCPSDTQSTAPREDAPPPAVVRAIEEIVALLRGERRDLAGIVLDMDGLPPFHRRVYEAAREVPPGETVSYGELAARTGEPGAAQAVGRAMGANPFPIVVPCHRVLGADGRLVGFSAPGGVATKRRMLEIEGAVAAPPTLF